MSDPYVEPEWLQRMKKTGDRDEVSLPAPEEDRIVLSPAGKPSWEHPSPPGPLSGSIPRMGPRDNLLIGPSAGKAVTVGSIKDSNPKDALGISKVPMSTVPVPVMMEVALGLMEGGLKYGRHNYRAIGIRFSVYYDAAMRHVGAWWEGEDIDADSGLSHITKAISTLVVLRDAMIRDKFVDDRPPGTSGFIEKLNQKAAELLVKYPEPEAPFLGTDYPPTEYKE